MGEIIIKDIEKCIGKRIRSRTILKLEKGEDVKEVVCGAPTIDLKFTDKELARLILKKKWGHILNI